MEIFTAGLVTPKTKFDPICAVVAAPSATEMAAQLRRALRFTRTAELRLDWLRNGAERRRLFAWLARHKPAAKLIATCRRRAAGGRFPGGLVEQRKVLEAAAEAGCRWYDLEIESVEAAGEFELIAPGRADAIISLHRFGAAWEDPQALLGRFRAVPGTIWKLAVECRGLRDAVHLIRLGERQRRASGMIVVPMGSHTMAARILAPSHGSLFTYAAESAHTAPGQPSLETAVREYRADRITPRTGVYGIVGNKAGHSISPAMHNAAFAARGYPGVYLPFPVERLEDFLGAIGPLGIRGFSVTIPYKQAIVAHLAGCDALAHRLGAVNTVVVRRGRLYGYNTDYAGVLAALRPRVQLPGCRALILGAGGAARAAAFALADSGSRVVICARRMEQAAELARASGAQTIARAELRRRSFDLIVNATPAGMAPDRSSPLAGAELRAPLVFDMVYRPLETPLLRQAASRGLGTISGLEMLVAQGVAQWELWTRKRAPAGKMRRAALGALRRAETEG